MKPRLSLLRGWVLLCLGAVALRGIDTQVDVAMAAGASADIRLTVPGARAPQGGFLPVRVRIANRGTSERTWRLELGSGLNMMMGLNSGGQLRAAYAFTVPAAATHEFFIFVPVPGGAGNRGGGSSLQGVADGPEVERSNFYLPLSFGWNGLTSPVAIESALEAGLVKILTTVPPGTPAPLPGPASRFARSRSMSAPSPANAMERVSVIDPAAWPADWRLWSSFPLIMLEEQSWERLDAARRRALLDWVALGGRLLLLPDRAGDLRRVALGGGEIVTLPRPLAYLGRNDFAPFGLFDRGRTPSTLPAETLIPAEFWSLSPRDWELGGKHAWLTAFIVVFGVLIGPVNLFFFAPTGRRHRLFVTVPIISVAASVVLFVIITASDGFGGEGTRRAVVVLLPEQNEAAVFQKQISRTGMLGGREFALSADVQLDRLADGDMFMGAGPQLWRKDDTASGDWFTSRTTQQHLLRRLVPTRERIELVSAPGADPVVQSTVAATLRDFIFKDEAGKTWTAPELAPGVRVALKRAESHALPRYLPPDWAAGTFYALGDPAGPGAIATLPSIRWRDDKIVFTGRPFAAPTNRP